MFLGYFFEFKNRSQTSKYIAFGISFSDLFLSLKKQKTQFRTLYTTLREGPCFVCLYVFLRFSVCLLDRFFWPLWEHFWPILVAPETLQIGTWPSKVMLSSKRNARFQKKRFVFIKNVVFENSSKSIPKKTSKSDLKVRKNHRRQTLKKAPESASEPWPLQGRLLGRPGVAFSSFSVPFCINITNISFSFLEEWPQQNNPAEKLSANPMSH